MPDILFSLENLFHWQPAAPWLWMWSLAVILYFVAKAATLAWLKTEGRSISLPAALAFLFAWVGMDARPFASDIAAPRHSAATPLPPGLIKAFLGAILLWGIAPLFNGLVAGWIGMTGIILLLHFGLFHLLAAFWNRRGVAVEPIMNRPLHAQSLAEFWGARWNRAFNELMFYFIFRPAVPRAGIIAATFIVFLVSGLIHDLVISLPARAGYGLPTAYFLIQALGLLLQRTPHARQHKLHTGWRGRLFTFLFLVAPLPLLFHAPFVERVILPFMQLIGAGTIGGNYD